MTIADSAKPPVLRGFLQALQPNRIRGWAYAPLAPDVHLRIEVFVDGERLVQVIASQHFPDLAKNGIGNGDHGFLIEPRVALPTEEPDRIEIVAIGPAGARRTLGLAPAPPNGGKGAPPAIAKATPPKSAGPGHIATAMAPLPAPAIGVPAKVGTHPNAAQYPVFILGAARSGTSAMVKALRQTRRYEGFNEGHLLTLLAQMTATVTAYYTPYEPRRPSPHLPKTGVPPGALPSTLLAHTKKPAVLDMLTLGFGAILRAAHPSLYWFDKTPGPEMIRAAHVMAKTWPNARFVFMKRRPVDNIESRRRKFPSTGFEENCRSWSECMIAWATVRGRLGKASIEVDQAQLVSNPAGVAKRVAALLGLDEAQAELLRASLVNEDRPQQTGTELAPAKTLATVDWTEAMKQQFRDICGEAIAMYGYEADLAIEAVAPERSERTKRRKPADC